MVVRVNAELRARFAAACDHADVMQSHVVRDLLEEAILYIQDLGGRWWPPRIVRRDAPRMLAADPHAEYDTGDGRRTSR